MEFILNLLTQERTNSFISEEKHVYLNPLIFLNRLELFPRFGSLCGLASTAWWFQCVTETYKLSPIYKIIPNEIDILMPILFKELFYDIFETSIAWELKENVMELLLLLDERRNQCPSIRLGIISNSDERTTKVLKGIFFVILTSLIFGYF